MAVQLTRQKCVACRRDSPAVTPGQVEEFKPQVPAWEMVTEGGIPKLSRVFTFPDFAQALLFTRRVGELAEQEGHHPRIITEWGKVTVTWWTHKIRNLHVNDFIAAAKTDQLYRG
jgi:4a-hydroxytetrahydrobiopterin dehydratase